MQLEYKVLSLAEFDEVYGLAERNFAVAVPDETERMFQSWHAKWRREELEHYLQTGWSFIAYENGKAVGFFLAQAFRYFRAQMQTLWIEHIEAEREDVRDALVDVAVRVGRDNHIQRVLFADSDKLAPQLQKWSPSAMMDSIAEIKTTKG